MIVFLFSWFLKKYPCTALVSQQGRRKVHERDDWSSTFFCQLVNPIPEYVHNISKSSPKILIFRRPWSDGGKAASNNRRTTYTNEWPSYTTCDRDIPPPSAPFRLWQYRLRSFQGRDTKLKVFWLKINSSQIKSLNFGN